MKLATLRLMLAFVALSLSQALSANGPVPVPWGLFCSAFESIPSHEVYVGNGDFCYKFELSCHGDVTAGAGGELWPDGTIGFGMGANEGPPRPPPAPGQPPVSPECGGGFGHYQNAKVEHACTFDSGKAELEIKTARPAKCF